MINRQLIAVAIVIAGCITCIILGYRRGYNSAGENAIVARVDTLIIRDTIVCYEPREVTKRVVERVYIKGERVTDTINIHDTVTIAVEREQKEYGDSTYRAWVSGIAPAMDSIKIYRTNLVIKEQVVNPAPRVGFSAQLGIAGQYGFIHRQFDIGPYIGVGLHYRF